MTSSNIELAAALTEAWLSNANTRASADDVLAFLLAAHAALGGLVPPAASIATADDEKQDYTAAVSVRKSLTDPDRIVSMIDGKPYSSLRRHLKTNGLTPDQYRQRYGLKPDYPMVAPGYSKARSETAKRLGLGGDRRKAAEAPAEPPAAPTSAAKKPRARLGIAAAKDAAKAHLGGQAGEVEA